MHAVVKEKKARKKYGCHNFWPHYVWVHAKALEDCPLGEQYVGFVVGVPVRQKLFFNLCLAQLYNVGRILHRTHLATLRFAYGVDAHFKALLFPKLQMRICEQPLFCLQVFFPAHNCVAYCILQILCIEAEHAVFHVFAVVAEIAVRAVCAAVKLKAARELCGKMAVYAKGKVPSLIAAKRVFASARAEGKCAQF